MPLLEKTSKVNKTQDGRNVCSPIIAKACGNFAVIKKIDRFFVKAAEFVFSEHNLSKKPRKFHEVGIGL